MVWRSDKTRKQRSQDCVYVCEPASATLKCEAELFLSNFILLKIIRTIHLAKRTLMFSNWQSMRAACVLHGGSVLN